MTIHYHAGKLARPEDIINIAQLVRDYFLKQPNVSIIEQRVTFGTSGHRGCAAKTTFNELHIVAICQAIAEHRKSEGYTGPLFLGKDTHALSEPAFATAISVLIANNVPVVIQEDALTERGFTPTPVISRLIICHNKVLTEQQRINNAFADGLIITPSHNPPTDGGIKYNPPHGGPAEGEVTQKIEQRANEIIQEGFALEGANAEKLLNVKQIPVTQAIKSPLLTKQDFISHYVNQLDDVIDMRAIAKSGITIGVDPLGGAGIDYWPVIAEKYGININIVNPVVDASFHLCL